MFGFFIAIYGGLAWPFVGPLFALIVGLYTFTYLAGNVHFGTLHPRGAVAVSSVAKYWVAVVASFRGQPKTEGELKRYPIAKRAFNLRQYLDEKTNSNVFVCGASGSGKSRLVNYLLQLYDDEVKDIFSFKPRDEYLDIGIPIVDMSAHLPDAFTHADDFVAAFLVTYSMTAQGITAASLSSLLHDLAKKSKSWPQFSRNLDDKMKEAAAKRNEIQRNALTFIDDNTKPLVSSESSTFKIPLDKSLVFDFSKLGENAKTFYAELVLRNLWRELTSEESTTKRIICVDEAHRLLGSFEKFHSIFVELAREVRAFGSLWTSSQNYGDIPDELAAQFQTTFIFTATKKDDLDALKAIDEKLSFAVTNMPEHLFTDARYKFIHDVVPELTLFWTPRKFERVYFDVETKTETSGKSGEQVPPDGEKVSKNADWPGFVLAELEQQPRYTLELARLAMAKFKVEKNEAKLRVSTAFETLKNEGRVAAMQYEQNGKTAILYYLVSAEMSQLHHYMTAQVSEILNSAGVKNKVISQEGHVSTADVAAKDFVVEIETGLGHDRGPLVQRINAADKRVYIVVPNSHVARKYKDFTSKKTSIMTLDEFRKSMLKVVE
jgi:hypothetical protein